jgi:hypothetical protein
MKKAWIYSGLFLIITGIIHIIYALVSFGSIYLDIIRDGLVNVTSHDYARSFAFWFLVCGIFVILLGAVLQHYQKREHKPAPLFLGYGLFIFSIIGCIIEPISGFWLFIPQSLIIIRGNKKK